MTAQLPASKFNDVLHDAMAELGRWPNVNQLVLKRIERDALSLRTNNVDVSGSLEISGICAAALGDPSKAMECARKVRFSSGEDHLSALRIARALSMVGWNEEANQIADVSLEGYVGDIEVADAAALVFMNSGRVVKASRLLGGRVTLSALSNNFHSPEASSMIDQVLACANWTQEDIENPLRFVRLFLREKMVLLHDVVSKIGGIEAGAAPRLISEFSVAMNPELAVAMEADLYAALAEKNFPAETSGFLVVMLSAAHHSVGH